MLRLALAASVLLGVACSESAAEDPLAARGRAVYLANCIACHATDPARAGGIGPEVAGASRELLEARVLRGEYPAGYVPKRATGAMPRFPQLEPDLAALHAFLTSAKPGGG